MIFTFEKSIICSALVSILALILPYRAKNWIFNYFISFVFFLWFFLFFLLFILSPS